MRCRHRNWQVVWSELSTMV